MKYEEILPLMRQGEMVSQDSRPRLLYAICDLKHIERKPFLAYAVKPNTGQWFSPVELSGTQILGEDWTPCGRKPD